MFQSPQPLVAVIGRLVPVYSTGSPTMEFWNSHCAFSTLIPVQPWLTFACPCDATDHGAAWRNSPEFVRRMANWTFLRSYPCGAAGSIPIVAEFMSIVGNFSMITFTPDRVVK